MVAGAVLLLAGCSGAGQPAGTPPTRSAPTEPIPASAQRFVHRTFHALDRSCSGDRDEAARLSAITERFADLYRRYPSERYAMTIDDESATMLSAVLVLRNELRSCSPAHAARLDPLLPEGIRRALTPLSRP